MPAQSSRNDIPIARPVQAGWSCIHPLEGCSEGARILCGEPRRHRAHMLAHWLYDHGVRLEEGGGRCVYQCRRCDTANAGLPCRRCGSSRVAEFSVWLYAGRV